jgi:hypothetical protein
MYKKCDKCGKLVDSETKFCINCGTPILGQELTYSQMKHLTNKRKMSFDDLMHYSVEEGVSLVRYRAKSLAINVSIALGALMAAIGFLIVFNSAIFIHDIPSNIFARIAFYQSPVLFYFGFRLSRGLSANSWEKQYRAAKTKTA